MDNRLLSLYREYIHAVDAMSSGRYSTAEIRQLDSERQNLHNELVRMTGLSRRADMYRHAKNELRAARMRGSSAADYEEE